jgi:3-dehydroquinate dehydratase II
MNILVIHGPNLNLLGEREGDEKGRTLDELNHELQALAERAGLSLRVFQSNHEGALIDRIHAERKWADGILINPGALTHTSYVLRDALAAVGKPTLEVHLTDIRRRESWRRKSVIKDVCAAQVRG